MKSVSEISPEGQTAGERREARRDWKITEMPPVNAQSLELVELGFLRVDSINRNQILSEIRSHSRPDRCIWHANRGKSNQLSNQSNVLSITSVTSWLNFQDKSILVQFPKQSIKSLHLSFQVQVLSKSLFHLIH